MSRLRAVFYTDYPLRFIVIGFQLWWLFNLLARRLGFWQSPAMDTVVKADHLSLVVPLWVAALVTVSWCLKRQYPDWARNGFLLSIGLWLWTTYVLGHTAYVIITQLCVWNIGLCAWAYLRMNLIDPQGT